MHDIHTIENFKDIIKHNVLNENMRIKQVVETYPVSKATIWRFVKQGKLNAYCVSAGITIFKRSELEAFFNGGAK